MKQIEVVCLACVGFLLRDAIRVVGIFVIDRMTRLKTIEDRPSRFRQIMSQW